MKKICTYILFPALAIVLAAALFIPKAYVSAASLSQTGTPPEVEETPPPPGENAPSGERQGHIKQSLERLYTREQEWLTAQAERLNKSDKINAWVNQLIEKIRAKGLDPAPVEEALANFNTEIAKAQREHLEAKAILTIHAGFNDNGKVVQIDEARQTVLTAGKALKNARHIMLAAARGLFQALGDFKQAHRNPV